MTAYSWLQELLDRYPVLTVCKKAIEEAYHLIYNAIDAGGIILLCGNGGSCADCSHIAGELLKGFILPREISGELHQQLVKTSGERGEHIARKLQMGIPAIDLCAHTSLLTAVSNDTDPNMIFAQQLMAFSNPANVLVGISPIGKAENVLNAFHLARALGIKTIGMTGLPGNELAQLSDVAIIVPQEKVHLAQELHLPVYHTLCLMLEAELFQRKSPSTEPIVQ